MVEQLLALFLFAAVFVVAGLRGVHVGVVALVGASVAGLLIADMSPEDVLAGFPVGLMVLLAGVTLFFGLAQANGTVDAIINRSLARFSGRAYLMPVLFFLLAALVAAMAATAALAIIPIAMQVARRYRIDPMLMSVSVGAGLTVGMFAPMGLFGLITYGTAEEAGIELSPLWLFATALGVNIILLIAGYVIYGGYSLYRERTSPVESAELVMQATGGGHSAGVPGQGGGATGRSADSGHSEDVPAFTGMQRLTIWAMILFVGLVVGMELLGMRADIGMISFALAALLLVVDPSVNKLALSKIDWSTILLVGGIITYVNVLQTMGAVEMFGEGAAEIGSPLVAAFFLFVVGGLVSAFASTTGTLAAIVPLAIPLAATGEVSGWAAIAALALCSALADVAPFSTVGATMVATAPERPGRSIHSRLFAWGMAMVIVGPVLLMAALVIPTSL